MAHRPDGMGMDRHRERQNMKEAANYGGDQFRLHVEREHPGIEGRTVVETWGRGSEDEMQEKAEEKREEYPDYEFSVVPE